MNYYERYCGDYQRDTAHLSLAEHGVYTMLLDTYFSVEKPLPTDFSSLYRVCRAMTRLEQQAVKAVAEQFFPVSEVDGLRHNHRADREIAKARPKIEAARLNGRKGGRPSAGDTRKKLRQETEIPGGLTAGSGIATQRTDPGEPGGKTPQHQHQHQFSKNMECGETRNIYIQEGQGGAPAPAPESVSFNPGNVALQPESHKTETSSQLQPGVAGACCKVLTRLGVQGCNPHHPTLVALLQAGALEDEFVQAARNAAARGKQSFAYVVGTVKRQREEAAGLVLHCGRMPNSQELLESSNQAAAEGWTPPELREPDSKETWHAN
ncbi:MAG: YdaU family protein [Nitrosospira sp.]|nr:YdaU family protein [Nitrosospira sp.]